MNNRYLQTFASTALILLIAGCSEDNSTFESSPTGTTPTNEGVISQKNFTILFGLPRPQYFDIIGNSFSSVTSSVEVQIGDNDNRVITGERTINFRTEWGLIDPSCTTVDGRCEVTWRSGSPDDMPTNFLNNILAYSAEGQESFLDINGNGLFDDGDTFEDLEEPYIDIGDNGVFDTGDIIVDTINGIDLTGADETHNIVDGLYNGPNCSHTSLCSTVLSTSTVWESGSLRLTGDTTFTVGGNVSGLSGTVVLQNNFETISISADAEFSFENAQFPGTAYNVTVAIQPTGQTCTVTNGSGIVNSEIDNVTVTCAQ